MGMSEEKLADSNGTDTKTASTSSQEAAEGGSDEKVDSDGSAEEKAAGDDAEGASGQKQSGEMVFKIERKRGDK